MLKLSTIALAFIVLCAPFAAFGQVNDYYVSTTGSDSNSGDITHPWATIAHAASALTLGSGSGATLNCGASYWAGEPNLAACVHVACGTYSGRFSTNNSSTTSSKRIAFVSNTQWCAVIVDGQSSFNEGDIWRVNGSYETIIGFDVSGNDSTTGIPLWGSFNHVQLNHIHDISSCNTAPAYCTVPDGGSGIATIVNGGSTDDLIDSNVIHEIGPYSHCSVCTTGSAGCNGVHGIYLQTARVKITNNVIYHSAVNGIVSYHGPTDDVVANNTVFANGCSLHGGGIQMAASVAGTLKTTSVINNAILSNGGWGLRCDNLQSDSIVKNNDANGNSGGNYQSCITDSSDLTVAPSLTNFNANPSTPTISGGAVTWSTADYSLTAGSPLKDAGTTSCASGGLSPCAPSTDFTGTARPQGSADDIGAYEYAGASPVVNFSPASIAFGNVGVAVTSSVVTSTLKNVGGASLTISSITGPGSPYALSGGTCGGTLAAGASCLIGATCTPASTGAVSAASITVTTNASTSPDHIPLSCTGVSGSAVTLSLNPVAFGTVLPGSVNTKNVTLTNTGVSTLNISSIALSANPEFSQTNTCGPTVAVGANCIITIQFTATAVGSTSTTLTVTSDAPTSPDTDAVSGTVGTGGAGSAPCSPNVPNTGTKEQATEPCPEVERSDNVRWVNGWSPGYWVYQRGGNLDIYVSPGRVAYCNGARVEYPGGGPITLTASTTNYVYLKFSSTCALTIDTTGPGPSDFPLATLVTSSTAVISWSDDRGWFGGGAPCAGLTLTGDVTSSGCVTTLVNIPDGTTMAGKIVATNIAAPGTPASGKTNLYVDSTKKMFAAKNDAGQVGYTVIDNSGTAHNFVTSIVGGVVTLAQPAFSDLSGTISTGQQGGTAGGDLSGTYPNPTVAKINGNSVPSGAASHQVLVATSANTFSLKTVPDCQDTSGNHLNYTQSSDTFNCGTSSSGGGASSGALTYQCANTATGTTANRLVQLATNGSTCQIASHTTTSGVTIGGICTTSSTGTCGTTGTATVVWAGQVNCDFDNGTTAGDTVLLSITTDGKCHDTGGKGTQTYETVQNVGTAVSTNVGAGTYLVDLHVSGAEDINSNSRVFVPVYGTASPVPYPSVLYQDGVNNNANLHIQNGLKLWFDDNAANSYGNIQGNNNGNDPGMWFNCNAQGSGTSCFINGTEAYPWSDQGTTSGNVQPDATAGIFKVTANGAVTITNPANAHKGQVLKMLLCQDSGGTHVYSFGTSYINPPSVPTTANGCHSYSFTAFDTTHYYADGF